MSIAPTLKIHSGYMFNVIIAKDLTLKPFAFNVGR